MKFTYPIALLGLLTLPYFLWLGRPQGRLRSRRVIALILRALIVILLVLGLAGLQIVKNADKLAVVFLIDASDSMSPAAVESARQYAADAIAEMGPEDEAAIIVFGSDAVVERPMSPSREVNPIESDVVALNTDLAEAIRLGMALFPPGAARRMVILSDGLVNVGDAEQAARLAAASGVQIVAAPMAIVAGAEILVTDVDAPTRLNQDQTFDITVTVESSEATNATLRISGGGQVLVEQGVALVEGVNRYSFSLIAAEPGLTSFRVQVIPEGEDIFYQNNELSAFTQIVGPPRILLVADDDFEVVNLSEALLQQGLSVDRTTSSGLPPDLATLSNYQSVVLVNIPASELGPRKMEILQAYVRDLGGGLVVIGGPNAYGVGGYFQTPLEEMLPVDMQLKDQERLPQLTVVYVIDKSGSMTDTSVGGFAKIELAKEAIIRSVALLSPLDRVGVVAFDTNATWVVPLQSAVDKNLISNLVGSLRAGGGTDIYAGILAVSRQLPDDPGRLRHIILLTDGWASEQGIPQLVEQMYLDHGITLSVISIGADYDPFIEDLPKLADGRFHNAYNLDTIPEIFTEETVIATRAYLIEGEFYPALTSTSPILNGIGGTPSILGYVGTTIKPTAQQILITDKEDPLLAAWQYGLGRSVAWTSDATGRWALNWAGWDDYARFWSQAVRWTITEGVNQNVEVRVVQEGETARIIVDALDDDGAYLNGLEIDASVVSPGLESTPLTLNQVAPGRYEGEFTPDEEGAYFVRVAGAELEVEGGVAQAGIAQTSGWVLSYSPEYRSLEGNPDYLAYIAGLTGGGVVQDTSNIFAHNLLVENATQAIWQWLLLAAVLLLPFDIAVRRLILTRSDLLLLAAWLGLTKREFEEPIPTRIGSLLDVKERVTQRVEQQQPSASPSSIAALRQRVKESTESETSQAAPRPEPTQRDERPAPQPKPTPTERGKASGSTASSLLKSKRSRRGRDEDEE